MDTVKNFAGIAELETVKGGFEKISDEVYRSTSAGSMAIEKNKKYLYGSLEVGMSLENGSARNTDNGIVFAGTFPSGNDLWEGEGISYYFFFISITDTAYLGKTDNGKWTVCGNVPIPGFERKGEHTLKVERDDMSIYCYVDGELYVIYTDDSPLGGVKYGVRCSSANVGYRILGEKFTDEYIPEESLDTERIKGEVKVKSGALVSGMADTLVLLKDRKMTEGTFKAKITATGSGKAGLIFGYGKEKYYSFHTKRASQTVELTRIENGKEKVIYSNYLSGCYSEGATSDFRIVIKDKKAYCYFNNVLYTVCDFDGSGDCRIGFYSEKKGARFADYSLYDKAEVTKVDTLIFGHSYMEMWYNYVNDLKNVEGLGSYTNIGIGGSIAQHWIDFKESVAEYEADLAVYMIGINDLTCGIAPVKVCDQVEELLFYLKEKNKNLKVVLLGVNRCPARRMIEKEITELNERFRLLASKYEWINYSELEYSFCDESGVPIDSWFIDGLHPSKEGYRQIIVPAIVSAMKGENQPKIEDIPDYLRNEAR